MYVATDRCAWARRNAMQCTEPLAEQMLGVNFFKSQIYSHALYIHKVGKDLLKDDGTYSVQQRGNQETISKDALALGTSADMPSGNETSQFGI